MFLLATVAMTLTLLELLIVTDLTQYTFVLMALLMAFVISLIFTVYSLAAEVNNKALILLLLLGIGAATSIALISWQLYRLALFLWPDYNFN